MANLVLDKEMKGIIYYTSNDLSEGMAQACQEQILKSGLPIVSTSLEPINFGKNIVVKGYKGVKSYFRQIVTALENSDAKWIFFCEHDVLYHPSHFKFTPKRSDVFYFNVNVWKWRFSDTLCVRTDNSQQISGMVADRKFALKWYKNKLKQVEEVGFDRHFEPKGPRENFESLYPNICIRHDKNMSLSRWSPDGYRNKEYARGWREDVISNLPGWEV